MATEMGTAAADDALPRSPAGDSSAGEASADATAETGKTLAQTRREKILKMENITDEEYSKLSFKERVRLYKKVMGRPVSPEPSPMLDDEITEEGATVVYQTPRKIVTLLPDGVAKKWTPGDAQQHELEALRIAAEGGLLVPRVHGCGETPRGKIWLAMDRVAGRPLRQVWKGLSTEEKTSVARQLGDFMARKNAMAPPAGHIGGPRAGQPGREIRQYHSYDIPACRDERAFNDYLLGGLFADTPAPLRAAFARCLRADHRVVFTHGDFALRNILVHEGRVTGVLDWENAGWFPEYWEYVKFFHQNFADTDVRDYADLIFPRAFPDELVDYIALLRHQCP